MTIYGDTLGTIYILCLDRPIGNPDNPRALASHYLGFTADLARRLAEHAAGRGQPLTAAAVGLGIGWKVFYRPGTPELERWLKAKYKNTPCLCPRCCAARGRKPAYGFQPLDQLALDFSLPDADLDALWERLVAVPEPAMDWYEISTLRRWRQARAALATPIIDANDCDI